MDTEAGRADLDLVQLIRRSILQTLSVMRRETYVQARTKANDDPFAAPVIVRV
jgi:hypothetical protein